jgi:hypothetical protein
MDRSYKYAVLRVIPDKRRGEIVNVGIVVFNKKNTDVRLLASLNKVTALDGTFDLQQFALVSEQIADQSLRHKTVEEKHASLNKLGFVGVSDLSWFKASSPKEYEAMIERLMTAHVEPRNKPVRPLHVASRITSDLKEKFRAQNILGKTTDDIKRHLVVPNYPLSTASGLILDFVLKNGVYRVTETADLRAESSSSSDRRRIAADAAIKLDAAKKKFRKGVQRYVVYGARSGEDSSQQVNLLGDYSDGVFNIQSRQDMANYMDIIMKAASDTHSLASTAKQ